MPEPVDHFEGIDFPHFGWIEKRSWIVHVFVNAVWIKKKPQKGIFRKASRKPSEPIFYLRVFTGYHGFSTGFLRVRKAGVFAKTLGFTVMDGFSTVYYGFSTGSLKSLPKSKKKHKSAEKKPLEALKTQQNWR